MANEKIFNRKSINFKIIIKNQSRNHRKCASNIVFDLEQYYKLKDNGNKKKN